MKELNDVNFLSGKVTWLENCRQAIEKIEYESKKSTSEE